MPIKEDKSFKPQGKAGVYRSDILAAMSAALTPKTKIKPCSLCNEPAGYHAAPCTSYEQEKETRPNGKAAFLAWLEEARANNPTSQKRV